MAPLLKEQICQIQHKWNSWVAILPSGIALKWVISLCLFKNCKNAINMRGTREMVLLYDS